MKRKQTWLYRWNMFKARLLWRYWLWRHKHTPVTCGHECDWVYPYGWVPEAGCPVHDK